MIKTLTVINNKHERLVFTLNNPNDVGIAITKIDGLSPGKATINHTSLASNDGASFNSAKLESRSITISFLFMDDFDIDQLRLLLYKYFPLKKPVTLIIETDSREAFLVGVVENNDINIFSSKSGGVISVLCMDPYFYSTVGNTTVLYGLEPKFTFPFSNESLTEKLIILDNIISSTEKIIVNTGDSDVGMIITINVLSYIGDLTIYNSDTREYIKILESVLISMGIHNDIDEQDPNPIIYGLLPNDVVTISTVKGYKGITLSRNAYDYNILNALEPNSKWIQLLPGINNLLYTTEFGETNLQMSITNNIAYEGL